MIRDVFPSTTASPRLALAFSSLRPDSPRSPALSSFSVKCTYVVGRRGTSRLYLSIGLLRRRSHGWTLGCVCCEFLLLSLFLFSGARTASSVSGCLFATVRRQGFALAVGSGTEKRLKPDDVRRGCRVRSEEEKRSPELKLGRAELVDCDGSCRAGGRAW